MHKNARLTPKGRALMLARLEAGQHQADVAQAMGVSLTTVKKWVRRYRAQGLKGLADRSSRPHRSARQLPEATTLAIVTLRRERRSGRFIAARLGVSAASVSRVLQRAHLSRWRELEPLPVVRRYERAHPGELIHLDVKKLGRIGLPGHRVTGQRHVRTRGIGWEFVHVAIDDASRLSLATVARDEQQHTTVGFLEHCVAYYRACGITPQRVMTDNGSAYRSRSFRHACESLGLKHLFTKPYTPRTNGKAERFIQTALREWAYAHSYPSSAARTGALATWLHHYNWHRPHTALHSHPPISRLGLDGNNLLRLHS